METGRCGNTGEVPACVCTLERESEDKIKVPITQAYAHPTLSLTKLLRLSFLLVEGE